MVLAKIKIEKPRKRIKKKTKRIKIENLKNDEAKERLKEIIAEKRQEARHEEQIVEEEWKFFKETVIKAAEEVAGVKVNYGTKKKCIPWWNPQVREAVTSKMKAFRRWMKTRQQEDRVAYEEKRKEIKRKAKEDVWRNIGKDLLEDSKGTRKLLYSMAKNYRKGTKETSFAIKDKEGNIVTESEGIAERWSEYFEELLNVEGEEEHEEQEQEEQQQEVEMDEINIEEMKKELQFMKNGKAPGEDEIAIEIIKAGGPEIIEWLTEIFILACRNETTPEDWGLGIICPLFKKGKQRGMCQL